MTAPMLPPAKPKPSNVRAFRDEDIPAVAALHSNVFGIAKQPTPDLVDEYTTYFQKAYQDNPGCDEAVGPLDGLAENVRSLRLAFEDLTGLVGSYRRMLLGVATLPGQAHLVGQMEQADEAAEPTTIEIAGKLLEDGTMEGTVEVVMGNGTHRANWTAERLKERKPQ